MDKIDVWLLQFSQSYFNLIPSTFEARTDIFLSKEDLMTFVSESGIYQNVDVQQLMENETASANYKGVCNDGKLYIFHATVGL